MGFKSAHLLTLLLLVLTFQAAPALEDQIIIQPAPELRLISTSETQQEWLDEAAIFALIRNGIKFMDVTDDDLNLPASPVDINDDGKPTSIKKTGGFKFPAQVSNADYVRSLNAKISLKHMRDFLTAFTGFKTRYYKSPSGKESGVWLMNQIKTIADSSSSKDVEISVDPFIHSWGQNSIIARIVPIKMKKEDDSVVGKRREIIIISAHQDSVNQWNPWYGRSPGADDDGSGVTTIIEAFRLIVEAGFVPKRTLEFHFYSAEEGGLLGSQKVASKYHADGAKVIAMFQVDMTGYLTPGKKEVIGISTDNTDVAASAFLRVLTKAYCAVPSVDTKCGYACSDHASWNKLGVPAVFTFESAFNDHSPFIHTSDDTVEHISFEHVAEFFISPSMSTMQIVGFQGIDGAYSHIAACELFSLQSLSSAADAQQVSYKGFESFESVFQALLNKSITYAMIPIENSSTGTFLCNLDLLSKFNAYAIAEYCHRESHCLIGMPGVEVDQITEIKSHPCVLDQCKQFLDTMLPKANISQSVDTAGSVLAIRNSGERHVAAIASAKAAETYGMKILRSGVEDHSNTMQVNQTGAFHKALAVFAMRDINICKIESRPSPRSITLAKPWEYMLYIDFDGSSSEESVKKALDHLREFAEVKVLGSYAQYHTVEPVQHGIQGM